MAVRVALLAILTPYVGWLVFAYDYHFLDGVNLALHEGGHLVFGPFGQTMQVLGGTVGQLFFPVACAASFAQRKQTFEAAVCGVWAAESLVYTAQYLGDARAQLLPLVGGHIHDLELSALGGRATDAEPGAGIGGARRGQSRGRGITGRRDRARAPSRRARRRYDLAGQSR